jgi:hypothetical protein
MTEVEMAPAGFRQGLERGRGDPPTSAVGKPIFKNPYRPGAGLEPRSLVGRESELDDWDVALRRIESGHPARSVVLHGLRGMGKTVLLGEFYRRAEDRHAMTVIIEASTGSPLRDTLARALYPVVREFGRQRGGEKLERALVTFQEFSVKVDIAGAWSLRCDLVPERGHCSSGELVADLSELIRDLGEAAHEQGSGLVILIDEAQALTSDELKALCDICRQGGRLGWPLLVALAGLPNLPRLLFRAESSAEDLLSVREITLLEGGAARQALVGAAAAEGVLWDEDAVSYVVAETRGHPYLLQEYGRATWDAAKGARLTFDDARVGVVAGQAHLDAGFYRSHWEQATAAQRAYLKAMACDGAGPSRSGDIPARLRKSLMTTGSFRDSLMKKGLIYAPVHGLVAFAAMGMADFIARQGLP